MGEDNVVVMPVIRIERDEDHQMTTFEMLSPLDRQKIDHYASKALTDIFGVLHEETGWCGDIMPECWDAALPLLREAMAKLYRTP